MKRLNYYLLHMERNTTTYKEMYEGEMPVISLDSNMEPWTEYDPSYYFGEIMVTITRGNRLENDKPTLVFSIPVELLGITECISTEEGRCVKNINISPFIRWIQGGEATDFSTDHASGSTSQAANIMEAVSYGAKVLMIDEDSSAANFMIRDEIMKKLIQKEPVTPFTDRVRELYSRRGVSTILVIGGSGEYLSVADHVYLMEDFHIRNVTKTARSLCGHKKPGEIEPAGWEQSRRLRGEGFTPYPEGSGAEKLEISETGFLLMGNEAVDLRGLHGLISLPQATALGFMLRCLENGNTDKIIDLEKAVAKLYERIEKEGLDSFYSGYFTSCGRFLEMPRKQELLAVIDRMRTVQWQN